MGFTVYVDSLTKRFPCNNILLPFAPCLYLFIREQPEHPTITTKPTAILKPWCRMQATYPQNQAPYTN